jgi:16S rRNA (cytosine967-C5)-methyltransferase
LGPDYVQLLKQKNKNLRGIMKNLNEKIIDQQNRLVVEVLETLTPHVLEHRHPADRVLLRFFKNRRELGSRDRRFLSECFFSYFRWLGWTRRLKLTPVQSAAIGWLLDRTDLHVALESAVRPGWIPLGGKTLDEKRAALAAWFPEVQPLENAALVFPEFGNSVDLPAGCENLFYETLQQRPPTWLRLRDEAFKQKLAEANIAFKEHEKMAGVISIDAGTSLGALGHGGQFEVQDVASQAVAMIAAPAAGSDWWDACAGAGGKTVQMADLIGHDGKILATDVRDEALHECKKRAHAGGISSVRMQLHDLARDKPFTKDFDGVLVDAPCSGWGTWSRNPDARWRTDPRDPVQKRNLQVKMLHNAAQCVKPGGLLVYAVCTFTREETAGVLERFLSEYPEFTPDSFKNPLTGELTGGTLQIWPQEGPGDGMFIARLRKA